MAPQITRTQAGTALVLVMALGLIFGTVCAAALLLSTQLASSTTMRRDSVEAQQMADGAAAQVQTRLLADFQQSGLSRSEWLRRLLLPSTDPLSRYRANQAQPDLQQYLQVSEAYVATNPGRYYAAPGAIAPASYASGTVVARIYGLNDTAGGVRNLQIRATAYLRGSSQTVTRTLEGEASERLDFALLSRTPNCQFCHLQVQGNVGALGQFRPGFWHLAQDKSALADVGFDEATGTSSSVFAVGGDGNRLGIAEDSGANLTDNRLDSAIRGDVLTYQFLTNDKTDLDLATNRATRLNGVRLSSTSTAEAGQVYLRDYGRNFYLWRGLDVDGNGRFDDFPPIDRDGLLHSARGSIAGNVQAVPFGEHYSPRPTNQLPSIVSGQAVLLGEPPTPANQFCAVARAPLVLEGEIFVEGDVVIKGCIRGRGQIYSGRNVYIAGDLVYQNPPGSYGNYSRAPNPDAASREDIARGKDSLRLAANGSIILGDYTEEDRAGTRRYRDRTGAHHLRARFALGNPAAVKTEGYRLEELTRDTQGPWRTSSGGAVAPSAVRQFDGYKALVQPVYFEPTTGDLRNWLADTQYRELLGEAVPGGMSSISTWRINVSAERPVAAYPQETLVALAQSRDPARVDACLNFWLENLNFTGGPPDADVQDRAQAIVAQLRSGNSWSEVGLSALNRGYNQRDWVLDSFNHKTTTTGATFSIERPTQIQRVDAFLYSARRIGGLVNGSNLVINGGAVAPEVALTAPGVGIQADWVPDPVLRNRIRTKSAEMNPLSLTSYNYGAIYYDYRLRNEDASMRRLARLSTVDSIRFEGNGAAGRQTLNKVCRNAECN